MAAFNSGRVSLMYANSGTSTSNWATSSTGDTWTGGGVYVCEKEVIPARLPAEARTLELPDGAKLILDQQGNYRLDDSDAKVVYQANRNREFSPYLNASDLLAEFVKYVGSLGVRREDVLHLPIHLFVSWLIIEAAERDGDARPEDVIPVEEDPALLEIRRPRCLACNRFIKRLHQRHHFPFCSPAHAAAHVRMNAAPARLALEKA